MIIAMEEKVKIEGDRNEVLAEATTILHNIYCTLAERDGKEAADEELESIFKLAVMSEDEISEMADLARADDAVFVN